MGFRGSRVQIPPSRLELRSSSACGVITAFCMTAGAPNGVTLVVTTTPTGLQCHQTVVVDSVPPKPKGP